MPATAPPANALRDLRRGETTNGGERGPTALVVDDNQANRRVVRAMLAPEGFEVLESESAEAGHVLAREALPAVVLMDMRMPDVDGIEATRRLRGDPITAKIPIVALSAQVMVGDRERALDAGCIAYLAKPVGRRELLEAVRAAIESAARPIPAS